MPVGAPPPPETLEKLRPQLLAMLDRPAQCPEGGRVLVKEQPDGSTKPVDKLGGYSIRPLAYWVETGEYPCKPIPRCPYDPHCVDCGRFVLAGDTAPDPAPIAPAVEVPPPPPVPQPARPLPVPVERVGAGGQELRSCALVPVSVPGGVPAAFRVSAGVARRVWPVGVLLVVGFVLVVLWSAVATKVAPLEDGLTQGDVIVVPLTPVTGQ